MEFKALLNRYLKFKKGNPGPFAVGSDEEAEYEVENRYLVSHLMAHPDGFEKVYCFMVDVHGNRLCLDEQKAIAELEQLNAELLEEGPAIVGKYSELAATVRDFLQGFCDEHFGAQFTDSGAGCSSWHFGCHCTEQTSLVLCIALHEKFAYEVEHNVLSIDRHPWSIRPVGTLPDSSVYEAEE